MEIYGNRTRVRVMGILKKNDKYLLINHTGLNKENIFWHFPGGGLEPHETLENALKREFLEETNLYVEILEFIKIKEYISRPLHAIELYFSVKHISGELKIGQDPELPLIADISFMNKDQILKIPERQRSSSIFEII